MTIREQFRAMRRAERDAPDAELLREVVDNLTAPHYGRFPTRATFGSRGGRRDVTWRDLQRDAIYLFLGAGAFTARRWGPALDALLAEDLAELSTFQVGPARIPFLSSLEQSDGYFKARIPYRADVFGFDWRGVVNVERLVS